MRPGPAALCVSGLCESRAWPGRRHRSCHPARPPPPPLGPGKIDHRSAGACGSQHSAQTVGCPQPVRNAACSRRGCCWGCSRAVGVQGWRPEAHFRAPHHCQAWAPGRNRSASDCPGADLQSALRCTCVLLMCGSSRLASHACHAASCAGTMPRSPRGGRRSACPPPCRPSVS